MSINCDKLSFQLASIYDSHNFGNPYAFHPISIVMIWNFNDKLRLPQGFYNNNWLILLCFTIQLCPKSPAAFLTSLLHIHIHNLRRLNNKAVLKYEFHKCNEYDEYTHYKASGGHKKCQDNIQSICSNIEKQYRVITLSIKSSQYGYLVFCSMKLQSNGMP